MNKKEKKLTKTINDAVNHSLERMKVLTPEDRFQMFMEVGEWIFNDLDLDDELIVPKFKIKENSIKKN